MSHLPPANYTATLYGCDIKTKKPIYYILKRDGIPFDNFEIEEVVPVYMFAFVIVTIYAIVGFIGNSFVVYIYLCDWRKTKMRIFILCLAILDLFNCCFNMPVEAFIIWRPISFDNDVLCKMSRFTSFSMTACSSFILVAIAVDRFVLVYRPLQARTSTHRTTKIACVVAVTFGFVLSCPGYFIYGTYTVCLASDNREFYAAVIGKMCFISDDFKNKGVWTFGFLLFLCIGHVIIYLCVASLYILIGRKIYIVSTTDVTSSDRRRSFLLRESLVSAITGRVTSKVPSCLDGDSNHVVAKKSYPNMVKHVTDFKYRHRSCQPTEQRNDEIHHKNKPTKYGGLKNVALRENIRKRERENDECVGNGQKRTRNEKRIFSMTSRPRFNRIGPSGRNRVRKNTLIMRMVTIAFSISFAPYLVLAITRYANKNFYTDMSDIGKMIYHMFLRSYFLQSVVNPFIYSFMNREFRLKLTTLLKRLFCFHRVFASGMRNKCVQ